MDKQLAKALNDQINLEAVSAYGYLAMATYFDSLSFSGFSSWMKAQAKEELEHMMKIYDFELSGHAHRARLLASLLNLNVELIAVDLANRAHKQPDYLAKNPFGQVPVLEDGNRVVADSNAILVYLATQYDQDRSWYPDTPELMAQIQVWLSKAANELAHGPAAARLVTVFGAPLDHGSTLDKASALLSIMEQHLTGRNWLVGENRTIAERSFPRTDFGRHAKRGPPPPAMNRCPPEALFPPKAPGASAGSGAAGQGTSRPAAHARAGPHMTAPRKGHTCQKPAGEARGLGRSPRKIPGRFQWRPSIFSVFALHPPPRKTHTHY